MFVIVKNMHEDAITALETHNKTLAEDVIKRDIDADRSELADRPPDQYDHAACIPVPEDGDLTGSWQCIITYSAGLSSGLATMR